MQVVYVAAEPEFQESGTYRIRSIFGGDFNLVVWQFFVCLPNLNDANIAS